MALIILAMVIMVVSDKWKAGVVIGLGSVVMYLLGLVKLETLYAGLSSTTFVAIVCYMLVTWSLDKYGVLDLIAKPLERINNKALLVALIALIACTPWLTNTILMFAVFPAVLLVAKAKGVEVEKLFLPMTMLVCVSDGLILTTHPVNLWIYEQFIKLGIQGMGYFTMGKLALPIVIAALAYFYLIRKKLPSASLGVDYTNVVEKERSWKTWFVMTVFLAHIVFLALDIVAVNVVVLTMTAILMLTNCLDVVEAKGKLPISTLMGVAFAGAMYEGMVKSGLAKMASTHLVTLVGMDPSIYFVVAVFSLAAVILSSVLPNTGSIAILFPVAIMTAKALNISPFGIIMAIGVLVNIADVFMPFGYVQLLAKDMGGYKTADLVRVGLPLVLLSAILTTILVPIIWY